MVKFTFQSFLVLYKKDLFVNLEFLSKLPHSLYEDENTPEVCLMVKDLDKKDRDYEKTIRKYKEIIEQNKLENIVKQVGF